MCSILKYNDCMGRNYDYEISYKEEIRVIPKHECENEYTIIGMCTGMVSDYPLFYDGMNSEGLCIGALAFKGNAFYYNKVTGQVNIPSYKFPLEVLGNFKSVQEILNTDSLEVVNITKEAYRKDLPSTDLHWFITDKDDSIIVEQTIDGFKYYTGEVLTNNPPYPLQVKNYSKIKSRIGDTDFVLRKEYDTRGLETFNLAGDYTSMSRFERLSYLKEKLEQSKNSFSNVSQTFHLLGSVEQIYGATPINDKFEYTIYSIVYDMDNLNVYLKNYDDLNTICISKELWI